MRIVVYEPDYNSDHRQILRALAAGIPGAEVRTLGDYVECDIAVIFGGHKYAFSKTKPKGDIMARHKGRSLLCVEEAFVRRGDYYQVGWGGFAGHADFNNDNVPGDRWQAMGVPVAEWQHNEGGHIVVMGQLGRDVQVQDVDHYGWCRATIGALQAKGQRVIFRPHPKEPGNKIYGVPTSVVHSGSMAEALHGAKSVVTWNSTSAVDALIAGVPVVAMADSSIAWPVAGHTIADAISPIYPDRSPWLARLGYAQWTTAEMANGTVWRHLNG
jgi:hypothetical protein